MSVYLLSRKGRKGKSSLYLIYVVNKKRYYEFLKLYVFDKPKDSFEKHHNKETQKLAKTILTQKTIDLQYTQNGLVSPIRGKVGFLEFFQKLVDKKWDSNGNHGNWVSTLKHLKGYLKGEDIALEKIDSLFLEGLKDYLLNESIGKRKRPLSRNSALSYYTNVTVALKEAYKNRYIIENPSTRVKSIKGEESHREFLTVEEIKMLHQTDCEIEVLKKAYLFCCYTSLRFSDAKSLTWEQFSFTESMGWQLRFVQKKTKGAETLPISFEAMQIIGGTTGKSGPVFPGLTYSAWNNMKLRDWARKAGITKHVTFHTSRHTFATLALSLNTDIYTVSKLLGHKNVKTTQIYTKVIDQNKVAAVNKFSFLNGN